MIVLKADTDAKASSPINLSTSHDKSSSKSSSSFGELLHGVKTKGTPKEDIKVILHENKGQIVLAFDEKKVTLPTIQKDELPKDSKLSELNALLKGDEAILGEELETLELHPKVIQNLNIKEIKTLVNDAKNYLKKQILNSDGYKQAQIKDLPKTLKGLAQLAKKFDIDISKITLEQVSTKIQQPLDIHTKKEQPLEIHTKKYPEVEEIDDALEINTNTKFDKKSSKAPKSNLISDDTNVDVEKEIKQEIIKDTKVKNTKIQDTLKIAQTPIFKAQSTPTQVTSTEHVVQAKLFVAQPAKTPKDRADETLKLLLRGEKPSHSSANMTADFSVATAKVIAPKAITEVSKSLESLLRGDTNSQTEVKTEQMTTHKADSFEVKLNEAKQMVKYISSDVKTAIEDYKSPFTRVKVQLNPQKLGNVELTVVQRGKNLHVNISSNNVAVNALAANLNELKTQLSNNGINNATFNFNSGSENGSSTNGQQQNRQQEQKNANDEYNYFEAQEQNEEILSSLEIIVPSYA